jgi:hypothetical protein
MFNEYQITNVDKQDRYNPHERIQRVLVKMPDGASQIMTQEEVIRAIEAMQSFYVLLDSTFDYYPRKTRVIISLSSSEYKYIKTVSDGIWENNLLSLPPIPYSNVTNGLLLGMLRWYLSQNALNKPFPIK